MINALHLLWIIPLTGAIATLAMAIVIGGSNEGGN